MGTSFKSYMTSLAPAWLRLPQGEAWLRGLGDVKDDMLYRLKNGVKYRFPAYAADDAATQIGEDRSIPRGPNESLAAYRERLRGAWDSWYWGGTPLGMLRSLKASGYDVAVYVNLGKKYTLSNTGELVVTNAHPDGSRWITNYGPTFWSAFTVVFESLPPIWGGVIPSNTSREADNVRRIVATWRPAHTQCDKILIRVSGPGWGASTWGSFTWTASDIVWTP